MNKYNETLEEVANEYVTQNNRGTAFPIGYIVSETVENINDDGEQFYIHMDTEYVKYDSMEDISLLNDAYEYSEVDDVDSYEEDHDEFADEIAKRDEIKTAFEYIDCDYSDLEEFVHQYIDDDADIIRYDEERVYKGKQMFLTLSGVQTHIRQNGHNMDNPRSYVVWVNRNHEMTMIINDLIKRATVSKDKWNAEALHYYKREGLSD